MADLYAGGVVDDGAGSIAADTLQSTANTPGIPGVLNSGCVSQELALPAYRSLDQVAEKRSGIADHDKTQAKNRCTTAVPGTA